MQTSLKNPVAMYRSSALYQKPGKVDRENRIIHDYAVITRGEALGHESWVDEVALQQVVTLGNAAPSGIKARFTHPGLSADGLGKFLGRAKNFRVDGDVVRADLHLAPVADEAPDGKLGQYVMDLAEQDAESFGTSIVFYHDFEAERAFRAKNVDKQGRFVSPDSKNKLNFQHIRLLTLRASDVVDEPAANPGGFFGDASELVSRMEGFMAWALGISKESPQASLFGGIDPQRAKSFLLRSLHRYGFSKSRKETEMGEPVKCPECGHEWELAEEDDKKKDEQGAKKSAKLSHDCVVSHFAQLSADQARKLFDSRPDVIAQIRAEGQEAERKYRQEFSAAVTAAGLNADESKSFEKYYGRQIGDVKEFAELTAAKRGKPLGEGGDKAPEIPGEGQKPADPTEAARKEFRENEGLRRAFGFNGDPASEEGKKAEDRYVKASIPAKK